MDKKFLSYLKICVSFVFICCSPNGKKESRNLTRIYHELLPFQTRESTFDDVAKFLIKPLGNDDIGSLCKLGAVERGSEELKETL